MPSIFQIIKKGTTAAAGGNTLCDINQIVISLLGGKRNLKRASAYAAGKPTIIAKAVDNTATVSYTHLTLPTTPYV